MESHLARKGGDGRLRMHLRVAAALIAPTTGNPLAGPTGKLAHAHNAAFAHRVILTAALHQPLLVQLVPAQRLCYHSTLPGLVEAQNFLLYGPLDRGGRLFRVGAFLSSTSPV